MLTDEEIAEMMRNSPLGMGSKAQKKTDDEDSELFVDEDCDRDDDDYDGEDRDDHDDEELGIVAPLRRRQQQEEDDGDGEETPAPGEALVAETEDGEGSEGGDDPASPEDADPPNPGPVLAAVSGTELAPDALDDAVEQIRNGWNQLDRHFVCGYLALSEKLRAARELYNQKNGKGRGKKQKDSNQAPTPDFASYMAEQLRRDASHINKILRLSAIDLDSRRMIEDRPQLGQDFSVLHALAIQKEPEKRLEAIKAYEQGGRKKLMAVLKPAKARQPTPEPSAPLRAPSLDADVSSDHEEGPDEPEAPESPASQPSSPSDDSAPTAGGETETPDPAPPSAAPETPMVPDADPIKVRDQISPQASDLPQTIRALAAVYGKLLGLLPAVHVQRVRVAAVDMIRDLDRDQSEEQLDQAVEKAVTALQMEAARVEELSKILASLPDDGAMQGVKKSLSAERDRGVSLSADWLSKARARIAKAKGSAQTP